MSKVDDHRNDSGSLETDALIALEARLAKSSLFADENQHVHVIPATSNPAPFGFFGLSLCAFLHMGPYTGITGESGDMMSFSFALFFAGLGQFLMGWMEFQRKNTFGTVVWLTYGSYWLGYGLQGLLAQTGTLPEELAYAPGGWVLANCLWGVLSFIIWLQTFCLSGAVSLLILMLTIQFFLEAAELEHPSISRGTGVFGCLVSLLSLYIGTAIFFVEMYGRDILPLFPLKWDSIRVGRRRFGTFGTRKDLNPPEPADELA